MKNKEAFLKAIENIETIVPSYIRGGSQLDWSNTPGIHELVGRLLKAGASSTEIMRTINERVLPPGSPKVTRNAVIGFCNRRHAQTPIGGGKKGRSFGSTSMTTAPIKPIHRPATSKGPIFPALPENNEPIKDRPADMPLVSLVDLTEKQCKWPIGDPLHEPDSFGFCGMPRGDQGSRIVVRGSRSFKISPLPYCPCHQEMAVRDDGRARGFVRHTERALLTFGS